jgi:glutamate--cysteine ligase
VVRAVLPTVPAKTLAWLGEPESAGLIRRGLRGIEKECLRVDAHGHLSAAKHPVGLGSALTHPYITTDYSEALLEFVTPPLGSNWELLQFLCDVHAFVVRQLGDELLWPQSMPCVVDPDQDVPIACYGKSNIGRLKTVYRRGLGHRYGRAMQAIAGVHFNYSLPVEFWDAYQPYCRDTRGRAAFLSDHYLRMARNYRRHAWVLIYLFGSSPALCKSFPLRDGHGLESFDPSTWYLPFGTSLRMSDIGYRNRSQSGLKISLNSLDDYVAGLSAAITERNPDYEQIGVKVDGEYRQLNANTLQIENEYYAAVRPKAVATLDLRPAAALRARGVDYVEIRSLDLSTVDPVGVNQTQLRFVELLLLFCLFAESPPIGVEEQAEIDIRELRVAREGRREGLSLTIGGRDVALRQLGLDLSDALEHFAAILDGDGSDYRDAVARQRAVFEEPEATPSGQMLAAMRDREQGFVEFTLEIAHAHREYFDALALESATQARFEALARRSLDEARSLEEGPAPSFDDFLAAYLRSG